MPSEGIKKNQSIAKAFIILEKMVQENRPLRLLDLSQMLEIPSSTVLRFLSTLIDFEYVKQEPETSRYYVTLKLASLGAKVQSRFSYQTAMKKYLNEVSSRLKESVSLSVDQEMNVVYIDAAEGPDHILQTLQRIGKVAPMHSTGAGKVLLLNYSSEEMDRFIEEKGLPRYTPKTLTTRESFLKVMDQVRARGYAFDDEECEVGVKCVAFPIRNYTGRVVASMSVSAPLSRMDRKREAEIIAIMKDASSRASGELGYNPEKN